MKRGVVVGLCSFLFAVVVLFPYEALRERLFQDISKQAHVEIFSGPMWPTMQGPGMEVHHTTVQYLGKASSSGVLSLDIPKLAIYVPWISLVQFSPFLMVDGVIDKASPLNVAVRKQGPRITISGTLSRFAFAPIVEKLTASDIAKVSGRLDLTLDAAMRYKKPVQLGKTHVKAKIEELKMESFEAGGFFIPEMVFAAPAEIVCDSGDGKQFSVKVTMGSEADPVAVSAEGDVTLEPGQISDAAFALKTTLRLSEALQKQPSIELLLPVLEQFKQKDGTYHIQLSGTLAQGATSLSPF